MDPEQMHTLDYEPPQQRQRLPVGLVALFCAAGFCTAPIVVVLAALAVHSRQFPGLALFLGVCPLVVVASFVLAIFNLASPERRRASVHGTFAGVVLFAALGFAMLFVL